MVDWSLSVHNVRTGAFIANLPAPVDSQWATGITGTQSSTETFPVYDPVEPLAGHVDDLFAGNSHMLVRRWGNHVAYAQKIDDWDYSLSRGFVTVQTAELRGETEWRLIGGVGTSPTAVFSITNRSASGAIRAILARMMQWGPSWEFPIDLPADGAGGLSASWPFWKKLRISNLLEQIEERAGVETYFRPYVSGTSVRFQTRVAERVEIGSAKKLHLQADESPLDDVRFRKNFQRQVTGLLGVGTGSGEDQPTKFAGQATHPIIIRDTQESFPDLEGAALQEATDKRFEARKVPDVQWTVGGFVVSEEWGADIVTPGALWDLESQGDGVIPDGVHGIRVISVSGGNGRKVNVEVQGAAA